MLTKLNIELDEILASNDFKDLVGREILYRRTYGPVPRDIYWVRVLDLSPNGKYAKTLWLEREDELPQFVDISTIEVLDVLKDSNVL